MTTLNTVLLERVVVGTGRRERLFSAARTREVSLEKVAFELALKAGEGGRGPSKLRDLLPQPRPLHYRLPQPRPAPSEPFTCT